MSTDELSYDQILEAAKELREELREEEKEHLLFELSPELS